MSKSNAFNLGLVESLVKEVALIALAPDIVFTGLLFISVIIVESIARKDDSRFTNKSSKYLMLLRSSKVKSTTITSPLPLDVVPSVSE